MSYFDGIDLNLLFDSESEYGKSLTFDELTDELVSRAEETIGYKLPESYKELLRFRRKRRHHKVGLWLNAGGKQKSSRKPCLMILVFLYHSSLMPEYSHAEFSAADIRHSASHIAASKSNSTVCWSAYFHCCPSMRWQV